MIRAEQSRLFIQEFLLDDGKQRVIGRKEVTSVLIVEISPTAHLGYSCIGMNPFECRRNMSRKSRQDGLHTQFPLSLYNLLL
ncbi:hypothetical protein SDC9_161033 [bioreactor metagenome]|uniref:Uncharacterized protein n=1 Tax=bioreactor metagenome TaxID=1076179 RepID=A0A645FK43_9ZZZZ